MMFEKGTKTYSSSESPGRLIVSCLKLNGADYRRHKRLYVSIIYPGRWGVRGKYRAEHGMGMACMHAC